VNSLVFHSKQISRRESEDSQKEKPNIKDYAHDVLLLIGNRKLCRYIVSSAPGTAITFFESIIEKNKYYLPVSQFSKNISQEAILNKDSILYHEDEGYKSGLLGYLKPFSQSIYGDHRLIRSLEKHGIASGFRFRNCVENRRSST